MSAFNVLSGLLLAVGYGLSDQFKQQFKKIYLICIIYFCAINVQLFFDQSKPVSSEDKYQIFLLLFTIGLVATACYSFCLVSKYFSDHSQQFNFVFFCVLFYRELSINTERYYI